MKSRTLISVFHRPVTKPLQGSAPVSAGRSNVVVAMFVSVSALGGCQDGGRRAGRGGAGLAQEQGDQGRRADAEDERHERLLVMPQLALAAGAGAGEQAGEDRPEQGGQHE